MSPLEIPSFSIHFEGNSGKVKKNIFVCSYIYSKMKNYSRIQPQLQCTKYQQRDIWLQLERSMLDVSNGCVVAKGQRFQRYPR